MPQPHNRRIEERQAIGADLSRYEALHGSPEFRGIDDDFARPWPRLQSIGAIDQMKRTGRESPPCTVTAEYHVRLLRVTPSRGPLRLRARVVDSSDDRATVEATLEAGGRTTSTCRGVFVAVKEGHPAYHRW